MTELELVQTALANLPRPAPPPRLRRAVMAQVRAEAQAEATASQVQVWRRAEKDGATVEWRQGAAMPAPTPTQPIPTSVIHTTQRRQDAAGITVHAYTWTR